MQAIGHRHDTSTISLGQRRGNPDLARFAIDLTWARADSESAARSRDYPSPPMSGSPPLPPKTTQESAERSQGSYLATTQDVHRGVPAPQTETPVQGTGVGSGQPGRPYSGDTHERSMYAFPRPETTITRRPSYPQQGQTMHQQLSYLPPPGPALGHGPVPPPAYAAAPAAPPTGTSSRPAANQQQEGPLQPSPKLQRKTKGHVASACVPCKRAHLRCDAQRPCSRCTSNGKEDACVDVQHKKRGRPRLRDDRESRFDPSRFGGYSDPPLIRRPMPLSAYSTSPAIGVGYEDSMRRSQSQSYRVLKSQPAEPIAPRFIERASAADANIFPAPLSISTRPPEPVAFLKLSLEIVKASDTFSDALSRSNLKGFKLTDIIVPSDREKVLSHQRQMQKEQDRRDPTYLPPILPEDEDIVIEELGVGHENVARYALDRHEYLTFTTQDGQQRTYPIRFGLAKEKSTYFVVVVLSLSVRAFQPPTPSPNPRDLAYSYQSVPHPYSQPTPVSATFDPSQSRLGDAGYGRRQSAQLSAPQQMTPGLSPGYPVSYAASPNRQDYPAGPPSYQVSRSELPPPASTTRAPQIQGYHLAPILNQQQSSAHQPPEQSQQARDDRRRVGIGGLIDRPEHSDRSQP